MNIRVGLVDYESGNFASVWSAFEKHDCQLHVIEHPKQFRDCTHVVLPGVGAFSSAMQKLDRIGLIDPIREIIHEKHRPLLGICVGMQILAECGEEFINTEGLRAVSGRVKKFDFSSLEKVLPLPHMGWNDVTPHPNSQLFRRIDISDTSFYFVHSYRLQSCDTSAMFSYADYGGEFIAALEKDNVYGVQFHPEKSQRNGYQVIANFLNIK